MASRLYEERPPTPQRNAARPSPPRPERSDWFEGETWLDPYTVPRAYKGRSGGQRLAQHLVDLPRTRPRSWRKSWHDLPGDNDIETRQLVPRLPSSPPMPSSPPPMTPQTPEYKRQARFSTTEKPLTSTAAIASDAKSSPSVVRTRRILGLAPHGPIVDEHNEASYSDLAWPRIRLALREPFLEFWGTFALVLFGDGAVAQVLLSKGQTGAPGGNGFGTYDSISWGFGVGLMLGIYIAGDSGGFLNPATTFTACLLRRLPWRRFPAYVFAQLAGGFAAAAVIYGNYVTAIDAYEGGVGIRTVSPSPTATAGIFATYPASFTTVPAQFFSEFLASAILMFGIFALQDETKNVLGAKGGGNFFPLALFFLMFGIAACFGWETGFAMNAARDFAPRLLTYAVGYRGVWSAANYYFWIPLVAPFCGCTIGGFLYDLFIYTGPSPVNSPYMGLGIIFRPKKSIKARVEAQKEKEMV